MPQIVPPSGPDRPENAGVQIVRWLRPAGCALVLLLSAAALVLCFTLRHPEAPGYVPPHESSYYAENLPELAAELNENLLPAVDDTAEAAADGDAVRVTADAARLVLTRAAVLDHYDEALFVFSARPEPPQQTAKETQG